MYASSFIETLRGVQAALESALSLETYRRTEAALRIRDDAVAAIDDVSELSTVALKNVDLAGYERNPGDGAIEEIVRIRIADGFDADLPEGVVERARDADRIVEREGTVFVPLVDDVRWIRNWWLLADVLSDWLDELIDGYRRVYRRVTVDAGALVETAFWTLLERLRAFRDALSSALAIGRYVLTSTRKGSPGLIDGLGRIAATIAGDGRA